MKNVQDWRPSKFVYRRGRLRGSRDPKALGVGSRLVADAVARFYDQHLKGHCRGLLLDLGCGKVPFYQAYKELITDNVCADWPSTLHGNQFVDCGCDVSKPFPFADRQFDTIILSDVLEHIPEPAQSWSEIYRILSSGGKCLLNVPFCYWLHEEPYDFYRYTHHALRRFAESAGFRVVVLEPIGGSPEILADILAKNLAALPLVGRWLAIVIQGMVQAVISTRLGARLSSKTAQRFPLGYFMIVQKP